MNKKLYTSLVLLMSFSLIGIILMQGYWIYSSWQNKEEEFSLAVNRTLREVVDEIQSRELNDYVFTYQMLIDSIGTPDESNFTDVFFLFELSPAIYDQWNGYEYDGPLSILTSLEINGESFVDITSSYFPNQENLNYIFSSNEPRFTDFNNDGLLDIYFWGGWATSASSTKSLFLINKSTHFENAVVPYSDLYESVIGDFNNDGYMNLFQSVDNDLKFATNIQVNIENGKKSIDNEDFPAVILNLTFNDIDRDGVTDLEDQCPNTSTEVNVNSIGCSLSQIDSDGDGILNSEDQCPDTPTGVTVDLTGCSETQLSVDDEILGNSLKLYPNPSTNILTIESKKSAISKVEIYTVLGEKIKEITSNFGSITTDKLPKGIYIIRIYTDKSPILRKIIKI